ncbi:MAG: carboxypeptidase regulatory-like domain-containing protein [Bryobacterales bacterium]|nr:carboxypeptidase regulatory-like domain-containing protein [Bryobacterales bacterium]
MKRLSSLFLLLAGLLDAQSTTGSLSGVVLDPTSAAVPDARIRVREAATNVVTETVSLGGGEYALPALRAGTYSVEVEAGGFSRLVRNGIEIRVNDRIRLDLQLALGATTESVVVSGAPPLVESESGALGAVIESRKIESLPLNTRNPFQLALLSPGVVPGGTFGNAFNNAANFIINGNRGNTSDIMIDGITNSVPAANPIVVVAMFPSPDALQEFKVQTNGYPAEFGRSGGGIVNMVMKSGGNDFHGVLYEFLRNSRMDANDFFSNRAGRAIGPFKRNQFGGVIGGPIIRDKAFFFFDYEGLRARSRNQLTATVPTQLERQGDFSQSRQLVGNVCQPVLVYDPSTTENVPGGFTRSPFAGNVIPASRQDAVGRRVATYFPLPNQPGAACTGINNFFSDKSAASSSDQWDTKLDWYASAANRFTAGLSWRRLTDTPPNHYGNAADTRNAAGDNTPSRAMRLEYNRTQSPTLLLQARFGITRLERRFGPNDENFSLTELGFPSALVSQMSAPYNFPVFSFAGYTTLGRQSFLDQTGTAFTYAGSMTKTTSRHTFKAGVEYRANQSSEAVGVDTNGNWSFDRAFTQGPDPNRPSVDRGHAVASLLLGAPAAGNASIMPRVLTSNPYAGIYFQDDFKVSRRLALNLGLRWEVEPGRTERFNQLSFFDFNAASPLASRTGIANLRGGLRFVGVDGNPRRQFDTDRNNLAPRFGFAFTATPKTVVRGGYGLFYLPFIGAAAGWASGVNGFLSSTQMVTSIDGVRPADRLSNPFPNGLQLPSAPGSGLLTNIGQDFGSSGRDGAVDRSNRVGYSQQWNFNLQRELPGRTSFEAAYIGNKGVKLTDGPLGPQLNQLTPEQLQLGAQLLQTVANPFQPFVATGTLSRATVTRSQLLRPYPQFLNVYNFRPAMASSIYHAMTVRVDKRFSNGLTLLASFTGGKMIDDASQTVGFLGPAPTHQNVYNLRADRSISAQDISRRLVLSYVYDLPFGRGRTFGGSLPAWANLIAGNWQLNGIVTFSTGAPLAISNQQNNSNSFSATQRPNVNGGNPALEASRPVDERLQRWFDTSVFSQPAPYTFGNAGRVLASLRRDGVNNWDFSVFKSFPFGEQRRVEFRAEFFNFTNTPEWAVPGQVFGNAQFGVVNGQANSPRQAQLALKVYF